MEIIDYAYGTLELGIGRNGEKGVLALFLDLTTKRTLLV